MDDETQAPRCSVTHCSHSPVSHSALFKLTPFDPSTPLPLGLTEGPVCLLGRGQGRHGSRAGVELRLLWEEAWGREDLAGFPRPRELTTCAPAFLAVCATSSFGPYQWAKFLWFDSWRPPAFPASSQCPWWL